MPLPEASATGGQVSKDFPMGPLPSLKGSEPWAPILKVANSGVITGFRSKGRY